VLKEFSLTLRREVTGGRDFVCLLTDDRELRRLNSQFLDKDYPTDVLSFPNPPDAQVLGEIAISVQRAAEQAREFGHDVETEICVLMLHGVLHLMGLDHTSDRGRMARLETRWRRRLGLPAGLIERAAR
jgi:probable rRNA maturation factor